METIEVEPIITEEKPIEGLVIRPAGEPPLPKEEPKMPAAATTPAPGTPPETPKETPQAETPKDNTAAKPEDGNQPPATPPPAGEVPEEAVYGFLSKMTEGRIQKQEDFVGLINDYNNLVEQVEKGLQPQFKDERAKLAYQIVVDNPGKEPAALMRTLRALDFNPDGKSAQEKLFEAYLQDPQNADLSPLEAQKYFEAEYNQMYSDVEENPITQRKQALAVREAEANLKKLKDSFTAAEEQPQAQAAVSQEVVNGITKAVEEFGGVRIAFSDNPQETDFINMAIDEKEIQSLAKNASNPAEWWSEFMSQFVDDQGRFDNKAYIREMWEMQNHQKKAQLAFQHGQKLKEIEMINQQRNASNPKDISSSTPAGAPAVSFLDAWAGAKK